MSCPRARPARIVAIAALLMALASPCLARQQVGTKRGNGGHSAHAVRMVTVAPGIRLETLDWGGRGRTLVLLSGLGDVAHVYDSLAPTLTDRYHVVGITRRGFGASSQPPATDVPTLVADLEAVLDSLGVRRATFIGHSIAGEEMTALAADRPDACDGMIYLDAAYDRSGLAAIWKDAPPVPPAMTAADSASYAGYEHWLFEQAGVHIPEAQVRAIAVFDSSGRFVREVTPDSLAYAMIPRLPRPDYTKLRCPSLAVYAARDSSGASNITVPGADASPALRRAMEAYAEMSRRSRHQYDTEARNGHRLELVGANHYVFLSHPAETLRAIRTFLEAGAPPARH